MAGKGQRQNGAAGELSVFLLYQDTTQKEYTVRSMGSYELLPVASALMPDMVVMARAC